MKTFLRRLHTMERGFTLIELLIVIAVLGALAGVVAPNVTNMMSSASIAAANTEVANVKTAANSYLAENSVFPDTSASLNATYLSGTPKATYTLNPDSGNITGVTGSGWGTITFDIPLQKWKK